MSTQVLVVEDERLVAKALQFELEQFGYAVSGIASTAQEAVDTALRTRPDVILMDIRLKGERDGVDAAQSIHARSGIPIIYLSAFSDAETVSRAAQTEAYGYLLKPYEERELKTTIEMTLAKHRAEKQLDETRRWLDAIYGGIDDAVIATDPDGQVHTLNAAAAALTGWSIETAIGAPIAAVCRLVDANGRVAYDTVADRVVCEQRTMELPPTTRLVTLDDVELPVEGSVSSIYDAHNEFLGTILVLRSIAARLELERLRRQTEERIRRAQKMRAIGRLAGGVSRRLNKLVSVILDNTSLTLAGLADAPDELKLLQDAEIAAQDAAKLVQRLHTLSLFSGDAYGELQQVDLNKLVPECLNEIKSLLDARTNLAYQADRDVWPVNSDELLLGQAMLELALNANAAMPHGGQLSFRLKNVTLTSHDLAEHPQRRIGDFVQLRVSDTGRGIPLEVWAHLFEPFPAAEGTQRSGGLGLAYVLAIVEQHAGWIECHSEKDRGARFDLYIPHS